MHAEAEKWLPSMFDSFPDGVIYFQAVRDNAHQLIDFSISYANQSAHHFDKPTFRAEPGKRLLAHHPTHEAVVGRQFGQYCEIIQSGQSQNETYWHEILQCPLCVTRSRVGDGILIVFRDQSAQHQRDQLLAELKRSNEYLEQFAYVASHDLQEPLRKIVSFGEVLQGQHAHQLDQEGLDVIGRMQSAAQRMRVLIRDILAYSRLTNVQERFQTVNVSRLVDEVLYDLETSILDKQADIQVTGECQLRADPLQLRQLFQNLIGNGLKFCRMDENGQCIPPKIRINCHQVAGKDVQNPSVCEADRYRTFYQITVSDNGIGFDPRQAERIFNVFQRLHTRQQYEGTGIGLAIVRRVVENHRGYITAEGRPGEGANFRVLIPIL